MPWRKNLMIWQGIALTLLPSRLVWVDALRQAYREGLLPALHRRSTIQHAVVAIELSAPCARARAPRRSGTRSQWYRKRYIYPIDTVPELAN
eukprot:4495866-Pleurochrysis_carterae.AAC.3